MILALLVIVIGFNNFTGTQILIGLGYDKFFLYSMLAGTCSNFLLNIILIPPLGAIGASIASVVGETLVLFTSSIYVYRRTPIRLTNGIDILKAFLGALVIIPLFLLLNSFLSGWMLVGCLVVVGGVFYVVFEFVLKSSAVIMLKNVIQNII